MTKGLESLSEETDKINSLYDQYTKEMSYLRNFSEHILKGCWRVFTRWLKYVGQIPTEQNLLQFLYPFVLKLFELWPFLSEAKECSQGFDSSDSNNPCKRSVT